MNGAFWHAAKIDAQIPTTIKAMGLIRFISVYFVVSFPRLPRDRKRCKHPLELDPVASPNAVKLRPRICSHLTGEHSLDTRQFDSKTWRFSGSTCNKANALFLCHILRNNPLDKANILLFSQKGAETKIFTNSKHITCTC